MGKTDHIPGQHHLRMAGFKFKCVCVMCVRACVHACVCVCVCVCAHVCDVCVVYAV